MSAVRRRLLAAISAAAASGGPITVGNSTDTVIGSTTASLAWTTVNPASATGFLNSATFVLSALSALDYALFTISPAGIVTDTSATITTNSASGVNNITLPAPLAVNAGDHLGIWVASGSLPLSRATSAGFTEPYRASGTIAKPAVGTNLTPSATSTRTTDHFLLSAST